MKIEKRQSNYMHNDADVCGFDWNTIDGPRVQVVRLATIRGRRHIQILTEHAEMQVSVSPDGRELTVYGNVRVSVR